MSAGLLVQALVTGLAAGAAYALLGIGFTLLYRLTGVVQLALGDMAGAAAFVALAMVTGTSPTARGSASIGFALAAAAAVALAAVAGGALYVGLLRPFVQRGSTVGWAGMTVAVAFAIEGVLAAVFPREGYVLPDVLPGSGSRPISLGGGALVTVRTGWLLLMALALAAGTAWWLRSSRIGKALRAIADDRDAAELVGLPVDRLVTLAFAVVTALAAAAALLVAPAAPLTPTTGLILGLKGLAAALLAKLGSPMRVLLAALAVGVVEAVVAILPVGLGPQWRDVVPLATALVLAAWVREREPVGAVE
jgi:branched-chain amino acid transport system permease protein